MEAAFLLFIQDHIRNAILTPIMVFATIIGEMGLVWIAVTLLLLFIPKTRKVGIMCALALIVVLFSNNMLIKNLVARPRPFTVIPGLTVLGPVPHDYSFASGHTCSSLATATVCWRNLDRKFGIPAVVLALLISLSRLYLGAHYPTDVLGGMVLGILIALLAEKAVRLYQERKEKKAEENKSSL